MPTTDALVIKKFPQGLHRLDWGGGITTIAGRTTPMVRVQLTPVIDSKAADRQDPAAFDFSRTAVVEVSVAWFPILRAGTFWRSGRQQRAAQLETATFALDVQPTTMKTYDAAFQSGEHQLIPSTIHRLDPSMANTKVVVFRRVQHHAFRRLIIPCFEISRFYYTNSSSLAIPIFSGALVDEGIDRIFDENKSEWRGPGKYFVQLGTRIHDTDHLTAGRIAASRVAKNEARMLVQRAIVARNAGHGYPIVIHPPFHGKTTMSVRGLRIPYGRQFMFLGLQIISCTGEFPFQELLFGRDNDARAAATPPTRELSKKAWAGAKQRARKVDQSAPIDAFEDEDPNDEDIPTIISSDTTFAFRAIRTHKIEKSDIQSQGASIIIPSSTPNRFSGGHQRGSSSNSPLLITPSRGDSEEDARLPSSHSLSYFQEAVEQIGPAGAEFGVQAVGRTMQRPLTYKAGYGRRRRAWSYHDGREFGQPRSVMIADVTVEGRSFSLIEIERRGDSECICTFGLWHPTFAPLGSSVIDAFLHVVAEGEGKIDDRVWQAQGMSAYDCYRFTHPKAGTPALRFARRLVYRFGDAAGLFRTAEPQEVDTKIA